MDVKENYRKCLACEQAGDLVSNYIT